MLGWEVMCCAVVVMKGWRGGAGDQEILSNNTSLDLFLIPSVARICECLGFAKVYVAELQNFIPYLKKLGLLSSFCSRA